MTVRHSWASLIVAASLVALTAGSAYAQLETLEARGQAPAGRDDSRELALDAAFEQALDSAVTALVTPSVRSSHSGVIRERVLRHARTFIAKFRVLEEVVSEDTFRVRIAAWINHEALRAELTAAGVPLERTPPAGPVVATSRPPLVVLVHTDLDGVRAANFGRTSGDGGAFLAAVRGQLRELGFVLVAPAGHDVELIGTAGTRLPLSDEAAIDLASRVGAGGVVVIGVRATRDGRIRGTHSLGARGVAAVRVLDLQGQVVSSGDLEAAAFAADHSGAVQRVASELGARVVAHIAGDVTARWPRPTSIDGVVVVIRGAPTWQVVHEVMHALRTAPGIAGTTPRRFERGAITLVVHTSLDAGRVAGALRLARFGAHHVEVSASGGTVVVEVTAAPESLEVPR